jgi:hypothetical protein
MKTSLVVLVAPLLLVGCKKAVDGKKVEAAIKAQCAEKNLEIKSVTCPPTAPDTVGESFTCSATDDLGTQSQVTVQVTDPVKVTVTWKAELMFEKMDVIGDQLEAALEQRVHQKVDVTCPKKNIFVKPGVKFECDAMAGSDKKRVQMTFRDASGAVDFLVL